MTEKRMRYKQAQKADESHLLARPKSMILILFVALLTHRIFSG